VLYELFINAVRAIHIQPTDQFDQSNSIIQLTVFKFHDGFNLCASQI